MQGLSETEAKLGLCFCPAHRNTFLYVGSTVIQPLERNALAFFPEYSL